jgi:hypothetical protein
MKQDACDLFPLTIDASVEGPTPDYQVEHSVERSRGETVLPGIREVDISVDRSTEASCLPDVRRLNEMRRNASGVFLPLARCGQSAERAGATPLFAAYGSPGGGPGRGSLLPAARSKSRRSRAGKIARQSFHDRTAIPAQYSAGIRCSNWRRRSTRSGTCRAGIGPPASGENRQRIQARSSQEKSFGS